MIEAIIFFSLWFIATEIIFFGFLRDEMHSFMESKIVSLFTGAIIATVLFGLPWLFSMEGSYMSYVWFYSVIGGLALFFGGNYLIHMWLKDRKKAKRKKVKK